MKVSEHRYRQSRQGATLTSARSSKIIAFVAVVTVGAILMAVLQHLTVG